MFVIIIKIQFNKTIWHPACKALRLASTWSRSKHTYTNDISPHSLSAPASESVYHYQPTIQGTFNSHALGIVSGVMSSRMNEVFFLNVFVVTATKSTYNCFIIHQHNLDCLNSTQPNYFVLMRCQFTSQFALLL